MKLRYSDLIPKKPVIRIYLGKLDDTALEKVIVENGVERAWKIIDKLTAPVAA
jgi:hypothetical protein